LKRLRVAHVITRLCRGGAQENTFHTVRLAEGTRFEVDLISGPTEGPEGSIEPAVQSAGIEIFRETNLVRNPSPWRDWHALRSLTRRFRDGRYDIVHTHTSKAGFLGRLAAARARVPIVVHTAHGNVFDGYFGSPLTHLFISMERFAARRCDRLIELTPRGIDEHLALGIGRPEQYVTIFSGIDLAPYEQPTEKRAETRAELGVSPDAVLVGGVGRLEPVKGFTYLVRAARAVAQDAPDTTFILVGDGSQREALSHEAANLGSKFRILGMRDDVPDIMGALDVLVLPSLNEGMGRVLLEGGASGIPCIATRVGGIPDIVVDGETGLLVPPKDAEALAEALIALVADPARRQAMGEAARRRIVPDYGLERMVAHIEALYLELAEEKGLDP
jgi:glycosyltransferase involved in cell wall biosynthesis